MTTWKRTLALMLVSVALSGTAVAKTKTVEVEGTARLLPGESLGVASERLLPYLANKALASEPGVVVRIVVDKDDQLSHYTRKIQGGIVNTDVTSMRLTGDLVEVKATFTIDDQQGAEYQRLSAENDALRAELDHQAGLLAEDSNADPRMSGQLPERVRSMSSTANSLGDVGPILQTRTVLDKMAALEKANCRREYQALQNGDLKIQQRADGRYDLDVGIRVRQVVDECLPLPSTGLQVVAWLGKNRFASFLVPPNTTKREWSAFPIRRTGDTFMAARNAALSQPTLAGISATQIKFGVLASNYSAGTTFNFQMRGLENATLSVRGISASSLSSRDRLQLGVVLTAAY